MNFPIILLKTYNKKTAIFLADKKYDDTDKPYTDATIRLGVRDIFINDLKNNIGIIPDYMLDLDVDIHIKKVVPTRDGWYYWVVKYTINGPF